MLTDAPDARDADAHNETELYRLADLLYWHVIQNDPASEYAYTPTRDVHNSPMIRGSITECLHFLCGIEWERRIGCGYKVRDLCGP